jgi:hypothetical protein
MSSDTSGTITVIRDLEQIERDLRPTWEQMQREEPFAVYHSDIDIYLAFIRAHQGVIQPYITVFTEGSRIISMLIGRTEKREHRFKIGNKVVCSPTLRCLTIVYGGILGEKNEEVCRNIVRELQKILKSGDVDVIFFGNLKIDTPIFRQLRAIPGFLCRSHFPVVQSHRQMIIPDSIEAFYQSCSKKHRNNLRRYIRKLEEQHPEQVRCVTWDSKDDIETMIQVVSGISRDTYQYDLGYGFVDNYTTRTFMETAAEFGLLRAHVLYVGEEPSAFQIGLQYRNTYFLEYIGYHPDWKSRNVGTVLFLKILDMLCKDSDVHILDFGFSDADYKKSYGNQEFEETGIFLFASRLHPMSINILQTSLTGLGLGWKHFARRLNLT